MGLLIVRTRLFSTSAGLQSYLLLHRRTRGTNARASPVSDTICGLSRHSPTYPNLTAPRQSSQHYAGATLTRDTCRDRESISQRIAYEKFRMWMLHWSYFWFGHIVTLCWLRTWTLRWSYFCLRHISWSEVALPNSFSNWERSFMIINTVLKLLLSQSHSMCRDSIFHDFNIGQNAESESQHCAGATFVSVTFRGQRLHSPTRLQVGTFQHESHHNVGGTFDTDTFHGQR